MKKKYNDDNINDDNSDHWGFEKKAEDVKE